MSAVSSRADSLVVPPETTSVGTARRFVADRLSGTGITDDLVDVAVLLVSEVVTNAVLHAHTHIEVRVAVGHDVLVEVADGSTQAPRSRQHALEAVTGRGLEMVEMLAASYGVRRRPDGADGKVVWFRLAVGPAGPEAQDAGRTGTWGARQDGGVPLELRGLPVAFYDVLQEHNEALLREYSLACLEHGWGRFGPAEVAAAARARAVIVAGVRDAVEAAGVSAGVLDVRLTVPRPDAGGLALLPRVLEEAERLAARGMLLTPPALPELRALRTWTLDSLLDQLQGGEPRAWTSPVTDQDGPVAAAPDLDIAWVMTSDRGVVLADDAHRILAVSPSAAGLLGWTAADLVGRRLVAIVPPALREAHVTGFTRQLMTGRASLLGRPLDLPALHRDGHDVPVRLTLERRTAADRIVFVGWLEAR